MKVKTMEEEEDDEAAGFNDWETLHSNHYHPSLSSPSSSSSYNHSPIRITPIHHHDLAIFPPVNHEDLPIPPSPPPLQPHAPPHAPLTLYNSDPESPSSPPPPPPQNTHLAKWVHFAFHLWNSKLVSILARLRSFGSSPLVRSVAAIAPLVVVLWFWVRRLRRWRWRGRGRQQRCGGGESVEQLKILIKERDEKIVQLLEQIAQMNKILLARYRIPVLRPT